MLGTRTKQINAYGKRGRRVVDATREANPPAINLEIISIFDDLPPPPEWKSLASKMKKRENTIPTKSNTLSPKVVGLQRKKRLSPVLSLNKKKQGSRVAQIIEGEVSKSIVPMTIVSKAKSTPLTAGKPKVPVVFSPSPPRAPLSAVPINLPGSPTISQKPRPRVDRGTPLRQTKEFSPFVDVDIIVLDGNGQTVRKERRVSRNAPTNLFNNTQRYKQLVKSVPRALDTDSEIQGISQPLRPKRRVTRKVIVLSDNSSSEDELSQPRSTATPRNNLRHRPTPYKVLSPHAQVPTNRGRAPAPAFDADGILPALPCIPKLISPQAPTRFHPFDSPVLKPRQLTPIRGGRKHLFEPPSPPSPTTPSDFDFSIDFSDLSLDTQSQPHGIYQRDFQIHDFLIPLLEECHQDACGPHNFSTFIESFPHDPILQAARKNDSKDMKFRKIGEASYSEVFGIGDVVLKVIPLRDESNTSGHHLDEEDGPAPTDAKDVRKEIIVTRAMGAVHERFVKLLKTYVVRGRYPEVLLQLWDEYNERKGSESVRPDTFKVSQVYAIIVLPNGGPDLEAYTFHNPSRTGWRQACSLFWQVAKALTHAEYLVSFEHRDLHWGQILVKNHPGKALKPLNMNYKSKSKGHRVFMDDISYGVEATLIDLGLSRMDAGDGGRGDRVHWTPFDEEVFMGEGDYQFDVYRIMRELTRGDWESFHPITNVLWLHYLLQKLIYSKGIKPPATPRKAKGISETPLPLAIEISYSEKDCYDCLVDIESWLGKSIAELSPVSSKSTLKGKGRRKTTAAPVKVSTYSGPARAGEIVAYGEKKGWVQATPLS